MLEDFTLHHSLPYLEHTCPTSSPLSAAVLEAPFLGSLHLLSHGCVMSWIKLQVNLIYLFYFTSAKSQKLQGTRFHGTVKEDMLECFAVTEIAVQLRVFQEWGNHIKKALMKNFQKCFRKGQKQMPIGRLPKNTRQVCWEPVGIIRGTLVVMCLLLW